MIRPFKPSDMARILDIWLEASIKGHPFIEKEFWESKVPDMRSLYIPASETYVYDEEGTVKGFFSLRGETLEAVFVAPENQGQGVGGRLVSMAKEVRNPLNLKVYKDNLKGIEFYKKCGFQIKEELINGDTGHPELLMFLPS